MVGRVNLIKMLWAPQLLYVFNNSPIWIPRKWFSRIDSKFRPLIWHNKTARISLSTLQLGKDQGGLTVLHLRHYFMASQIQHLGAWSLKDPLDPICNLLMLWGSPSPALTFLQA